MWLLIWNDLMAYENTDEKSILSPRLETSKVFRSFPTYRSYNNSSISESEDIFSL